VNDRPSELEGRSVGQEMLEPTRIYVKSVLDVLHSYRVKKVIKAMAHITGSGLPGNLPRVLPEGLTIRIKRDSWIIPPIFKLIAAKGPVGQSGNAQRFQYGRGIRNDRCAGLCQGSYESSSQERGTMLDIG